MGYTVVTGASGLIGRALAAALQLDRPVVAVSRRDPGLTVPLVQGDFADARVLAGLDPYEIDAVVHLAAVTGGCSEADGLAVNVEGTRRLMRYLVDRGCRRFVLASSIAAIGLADAAFRPLQVPIPDDHPCLATDAYGLSKHLMEQVAAYFARRYADLDVLCLRLSSVSGELPPPRTPGEHGRYALASVTVMALEDAVAAFRAALDAPPRSGYRVRNAVPAHVWSATPTAEILRRWYGDALDVSAYLRPGHAHDGCFAHEPLLQETGFACTRHPLGLGDAKVRFPGAQPQR